MPWQLHDGFQEAVARDVHDGTPARSTSCEPEYFHFYADFDIYVEREIAAREVAACVNKQVARFAAVHESPPERRPLGSVDRRRQGRWQDQGGHSHALADPR